jgi:hypothetical protein
MQAQFSHAPDLFPPRCFLLFRFLLLRLFFSGVRVLGGRPMILTMPNLCQRKGIFSSLSMDQDPSTKSVHVLGGCLLYLGRLKLCFGLQFRSAWWKKGIASRHNCHHDFFFFFPPCFFFISPRFHFTLFIPSRALRTRCKQ